MKRAIASIAAAATLGGSLVACSNDEEDTASNPDGSVVTEDKGAANATPNEAEENVHASDASETVSEGDDPASDGDTEGGNAEGGDSEEPTSEGAEGGAAAEGETVEQETADGNSTLIPADFQEAISEAEGDWGLPESIEQNDTGAVATFTENNLLVWSEDTDAQPVVGMIGQTWVDEGGLDNPIGLPTAEESEADGAEGWTQEFQNGVISWVNNNGEWTAEVEQN